MPVVTCAKAVSAFVGSCGGGQVFDVLRCPLMKIIFNWMHTKLLQ